MATFKIYSDERCGCTAADECPLGRTGSSIRCTGAELLAAGHQVEMHSLEVKVTTFTIPDRGNGLAEPVRSFVEGDVLIQEFKIIDGPRKGEILTLRTKMAPA